jgi:uncharacterized protein
VVLYAFGFVLDWLWPGTILFFYGAFFVLGALLFTLRSRVVLAIGAAAALAAAAIQWWAAMRRRDGHGVSWLLSPNTLGTRSPRGLLFDTTVNGTHPVLPWLAFLCVGIVIGRHLDALRRWPVVAGAAALTAVTYLVNHVVTSGSSNPVVLKVFSTRWPDRGLLYTLGTIGSSVVACAALWWVAERFAGTPPINVLAAAGRTTLSLYVLHVLVFDAIVNWWQLVGGTGLDTALVFALVFWIFAIALAAWWQRFFGQGPLERWYRRFGG